MSGKRSERQVGFGPPSRRRRAIASRRQLWRWQEKLIKRRLIAAAVAPTIALLLLAGIVIAGCVREKIRADRLAVASRLWTASGELASLLSDERSAAVSLLAGEPEEFGPAVHTVDTAVPRWWRASQEAAAGEDRIALAARQAHELLSGLDRLRAELRQRRLVTAPELAAQYRDAIAALAEVRQAASAVDLPTDLSPRMRAFTALAQAAEAVGRFDAQILHALDAGRLTRVESAEVQSAHIMWRQAVQSWNLSAPAAPRAAFERALGGSHLGAARHLDEAASWARTGQLSALPPEQWKRAQRTLRTSLRLMLGDVATDLSGATWQWGHRRVTLATVVGAMTFATLAGSLWLAWSLPRSATRALARIRQQAAPVRADRPFVTEITMPLPVVKELPAVTARLAPTSEAS